MMKNGSVPIVLLAVVLFLVLASFTVGCVQEKKEKKLPDRSLDLTINGTLFQFVLIPAGTFWMGSPEGVGGTDEHPRHKVTIAEPFYMLKYEVTQKQWQAVMGFNPSYDYGVGENHPVYYVTWYDCQVFISELNQLDTNHTYSLPSEAEWEYACRAGSETYYCFGDDISLLGNYAWYENNSDHLIHPVGGKEPNVWGLYDMHGNVWEWCQDVYHDTYEGAPNDGTAWDGPGDEIIHRGGSVHNDANRQRSAYRRSDSPTTSCDGLGLRLVMNT